jgi:hypothetical protein
MRASLIKECSSAPTAPVTANWLRENSSLPCLVLQCQAKILRKSVYSGPVSKKYQGSDIGEFLGQDAFVDRVVSYLQAQHSQKYIYVYIYPM